MSAINIDGLRQRAKSKLPKAVFDFVDGGAMDERTLRHNSDDFAEIRFLPKALVDVSAISLGTTVLGQPQTIPLILSPTGITSFFGQGGEVAAARAAKAAGIGYCLSTMATTPIETLARVRDDFWFQLYVQKDRGFTRALVDRAYAAGSRVLCLTVDTVVSGRRERDLRNGFTVPPRITPANALDFISRPQWLWRMASGPRMTFAHFEQMFAGHGFVSIAKQVGDQFDRNLTWKDVAWLKSIFPGKVAIKGILHPQDARRAIDNGADGIIVSNHGGRQLDGATSPIRALPAIVDAAAGRAEVLLDGGVRRGTDIAKALALGAKACMIGRPFLYGLAAAGEAGVGEAIGILRSELENTLTLLGCPDVTNLDPTFLEPAPRGWPANR